MIKKNVWLITGFLILIALSAFSAIMAVKSFPKEDGVKLPNLFHYERDFVPLAEKSKLSYIQAIRSGCDQKNFYESRSLIHESVRTRKSLFVSKYLFAKGLEIDPACVMRVESVTYRFRAPYIILNTNGDIFVEFGTDWVEPVTVHKLRDVKEHPQYFKSAVKAVVLETAGKPEKLEVWHP